MDDIDDVAELAQEFFSASPYAPLGISKEAVYDTAAHTIQKPLTEATTILWKEDGKTVGILAALIGVSPFNHKKYASELMWWVTPSHRSYKAAIQMKKAFEYWARQLDCQYSILVCLDPSVAKLYKKSGYSSAEHTFFKEL